MVNGHHFVTVELDKLGKKLDRLIEEVRKQSDKIDTIEKKVDRTRISVRRMMLFVGVALAGLLVLLLV
jgi:hypothetical protein